MPLGTIAIAALLLAVRPTPVAAESKQRVKLLVVVASESKISAIGKDQLRRIFGGNNRTSLIPLNQPNGSAPRLIFDKKVLGLSPKQVGRYWIDRKIRGQSGAPRQIRSRRLILAILARHPSAIGYVRAGKLPRGLRAIPVDGLEAKSSRYPLRGISR